jgi:serine/threonine protein kinase
MDLKTFVNKYKVPVKNVDKLKLIGSGANGDVWNNNSGKLLKFRTGSIRNSKHEYDMTKKLQKFSFVPRLKGNFYNGSKNGSLFMLSKVPGVTLQEFSKYATPEQLKVIRAKLDDYVNKLLKIGIIHGDLNPTNIMIEVLSNGSLKVTLIDFGRSRYTKNNVNGNNSYFPWPTTIGCQHETGNSRYCKLKYVFPKRFSQPSAESNKQFLNAIFGKNGGVVSKTTRLKNAINVIASKKTNLAWTKEDQKKRLINALKKYENQNGRIPEIIKQLGEQPASKYTNPTIEKFINMLLKSETNDDRWSQLLGTQHHARYKK